MTRVPSRPRPSGLEECHTPCKAHPPPGAPANPRSPSSTSPSSFLRPAPRVGVTTLTAREHVLRVRGAALLPYVTYTLSTWHRAHARPRPAETVTADKMTRTAGGECRAGARRETSARKVCACHRGVSDVEYQIEMLPYEEPCQCQGAARAGGRAGQSGHSEGEGELRPLEVAGCGVGEDYSALQNCFQKWPPGAY